jgi:hypothetical protein
VASLKDLKFAPWGLYSTSSIDLNFCFVNYILPFCLTSSTAAESIYNESNHSVKGGNYPPLWQRGARGDFETKTFTKNLPLPLFSKEGNHTIPPLRGVTNELRVIEEN